MSEEKKEEFKTLNLAIRCASFLAVEMAKTNASEMKMKLENVHDETKKNYGDFEIIVKKL